MNKIKLLIVEGNTKEENINYNAAGCLPHWQNFKLQIDMLQPNCEIDIVEPGNENSVSKILSSLKTVEYAFEPETLFGLLPLINKINKKYWKETCRELGHPTVRSKQDNTKTKGTRKRMGRKGRRLPKSSRLKETNKRRKSIGISGWGKRVRRSACRRLEEWMRSQDH